MLREGSFNLGEWLGRKNEKDGKTRGYLYDTGTSWRIV